MRRMTRRDLFRSAGVGAGALSLARHPRRVRGDERGRRRRWWRRHGRRRRRRRHRLERRAERHAELRELAALHRQGEGERPGDVPVDRRVHGRRRASRSSTGSRSTPTTGSSARSSRNWRPGSRRAGTSSSSRTARRWTPCSGWTTWCRCRRTNVRTSTRTRAWPVKDPAYDPGNAFTMAWQSGLTGIGWDPEQVKALRPSKPDDHERDGSVRPGVRGEGRHVHRQRGPRRPGHGRAWAWIPPTSTPGPVAGGRRPA